MSESGDEIVVWQRALAQAQGGHTSLAAWSKQVAARFAASGGAVLAHLSGTVVARFPPGDVADAVEVALDLLDEADAAGVVVSFGVAHGPLSVQAGIPTGAAIESAETLAVRARSGEVLLDPAARDRARGLFLFSRTVGAGAHANRAASIDRTHPRRDTSTAAIARLGPIPLTPATEALLPVLTAALSQRPPALALLRGPVGAGAVELIRAARAALSPAALVELGGATHGVAPLGSLRAALTRDPGTQLLVSSLTDVERAPLDAVMGGQLVPHEPLRAALTLAATRAEGAVWFLLSPLAAMDAATLSIVAAVEQAVPSVACVSRLGVDTPLPPELERIAERVELTLPPLRTSDARVVAQAVLGEATPTDVARRVAVLGGDAPASVLEAARAMIGAGDLVLDGASPERRFVWRGAPRGGVKAIALDALLAERLDQLDDESRRLLELVTLMPEWAPRAMLDALAAADGLRARAIPRSLDRLVREGWLGPGEMPRPASSFLRRFVGSACPPARTAEVHRFVAAQLAPSERMAEEGERALHLVLGGRESEGVTRLLAVAEALVAAGYGSSGAQLALVVLSTDAPFAERERAQKILLAFPRRHMGAHGELGTDAPSVEMLLPLEAMEPGPRGRTVPPPPRPSAAQPDRAALDSHDEIADEVASDDASVPDAAVEAETEAEDEAASAETPLELEPEPASEGEEEAVDEETELHLELRDAIRRRDFDALDRLAERAIAVGSDMQAVARIRALAAALRGDLAGAQQRLERMHGSAAPRDRRALLAEAMVALRGGRHSPAIRLALRALADARRATDERGEAVALFTLAACFRAAGRPNDAALLEARVDA